MSIEQTFDLPVGNRLVDALADMERRRFASKVELVHLQSKESLCNFGERIDSVYFPLGAVVSLLVRHAQDTPGIEVATIGNEGLVGVSLFWGDSVLSPSELLQVQVPGAALRMDAEVFLSELADEGISSIVRSYTQAFIRQICQQVVCSRLHSVEERCARWLLLTHDRIDRDEFPLTQEFLAQMLGVRRASVNAAATLLQQAGYIRYHRGRIAITNRSGLERVSCPCYQIVREAFDSLIP